MGPRFGTRTGERTAMGEEPVVALLYHLVVGPLRRPAERFGGVSDVEPHRLAVHDPVVRGERREFGGRREAHRCRRRTSRQRAHLGSGAGMGTHALQRLAHRSEPVCPGVEDRRSARGAGADAQIGEIVGVDELVAVRAVAEHEHIGAIGDPVEQDGEDTEPTVTEDGPRPHDADVELAPGHGLQARPLGRQLGETVGLSRRRHR